MKNKCFRCNRLIFSCVPLVTDVFFFLVQRFEQLFLFLDLALYKTIIIIINKYFSVQNLRE